MESIMKIYAFDLEDELYKPENALKWLNIPYTTITDMDNIPNCPDDIIIASPKQFKVQTDNWDETQMDRAIDILSPKFKKVIMFNDDYTGNSGIAEGFPFKSNIAPCENAPSPAIPARVFCEVIKGIKACKGVPAKSGATDAVATAYAVDTFIPIPGFDGSPGSNQDVVGLEKVWPFLFP